MTGIHYFKQNLILFSMALTGLGSSVQGLPVYDEDNRQEMHETSDPEILNLARSTVALFRSKDVELRGDWAHLNTQPFKELNFVEEAYIFGMPLPRQYNLSMAASERFYGQPRGAHCSGALVAPDLILTAGHCIESSAACQEIKFAFDFIIYQEGDDPTRVPASSVYSCAGILQNPYIISQLHATPQFYAQTDDNSRTDPDWALVRLDRPVTDRTPLALDRTGKRKAKRGNRIFAIGYPYGLPAKIIENGKVTEKPSKEKFLSNLDTDPGCSGSPIFDAETKLIVGVLTEGGTRTSQNFSEPQLYPGYYQTRVITEREVKTDPDVGWVSAQRVSAILNSLERQLKGSTMIFDQGKPHQ